MSVSIADALFTKTQQRVLALLFGKPDQSFYTNEIVRRANMGTGTVRRELDRLTQAELVRVKKTGNQLHYQANPSNPVYQDLLGIVRKAFGVADILKRALSPLLDQIEFAFVFGSVAKGEDTTSSDIDLMLVSDSLSYADLIEHLMDAEQQIARPINPALYTMDQAKDKRKEENAFITRVMEQPKLWVEGDEDDLFSITKLTLNHA